MVLSPGFGWPLCPSLEINAKIPPDLLLNWPRLEDWSHSGSFCRIAPITLEKRSLKRRHFFSTCNWAPVTMETLSSDSTGAVQTYEKEFHLTFLCKLQLYESQDKYVFALSESGKDLGREARCCRWMANRLLVLPSNCNLSPTTGLLPTSTCHQGKTNQDYKFIIL